MAKMLVLCVFLTTLVLIAAQPGQTQQTQQGRIPYITQGEPEPGQGDNSGYIQSTLGFLLANIGALQTTMGQLQTSLSILQTNPGCGGQTGDGDDDDDILAIQNNIEDLQNQIWSMRDAYNPLSPRLYSLADQVELVRDEVLSLSNDVASLNVTVLDLLNRCNTGCSGGTGGGTGGSTNSGEFDAFDVFYVTVPAESTIARNTVIKFNRELVNMRQGYNRDTGEFTVSVPGLYSIWFTGKATTGNLYVEVYHYNHGTGETIVECAIQTANWETASCGALVNLNVDDKIFVKAQYHATGYIHAGGGASVKLQGHLLR